MVLFSPSKYTGMTGASLLYMSFDIDWVHSISSVYPFPWYVETSPAGNSPRPPPLSRCSFAALTPVKLLLRFFISENGFTGRKYSDRFLILERRKFVRILKSGLMAATVLYRIIPSRAPKGWFDTMMKGPSLGITSSWEAIMSHFISSTSKILAVNSLP